MAERPPSPIPPSTPGLGLGLLRGPVPFLLLVLLLLPGLIGGAITSAQSDPTPAVISVRQATPVGVGTPAGGDRPAGIRVGPGTGVATGIEPTLTVPGVEPGAVMEFRLYRVQLGPGASASMAGTGYVLVTAETGAVRVSDAGRPPGSGVLVEAPSSTGGVYTVSGSTGLRAPSSGVIVEWAAGTPAVAWMATFGRSSEPEPAGRGDGVTVTRVGAIGGSSLPRGDRLEIRLAWEGASPIPADLGRSDRSGPMGVEGGAPVALVVAQDAGITLTAPDGSVRELQADQPVELVDARGHLVTGPLEDYRDEPLRYVVISARAIEAGRPGGPPVGTPGTGPAGTPVAVTIPADAFRWDGPPVACDLQPLTREELEALPNLFLATPELVERIENSRLDQLPGSGQPADQATIDGILRTVAIADACATADDPARFLRLCSGPLLALVVLSLPPDELDALLGGPDSWVFTPATPVANPQAIRVWAVEVLSDGRVGAYMSAQDGSVSYTVFILGPDGLWLLDESIQVG